MDEKNENGHPTIALTPEIKEYLRKEKLVPQESYDNVLRRMRDKLRGLPVQSK
jgi:hypothetical protein